MFTKTYIFLLFIVLLPFEKASAQFEGTHTNVYKYQIAFPDIPSKVVTYKDSQNVLSSSARTLLTRTYDANGFIGHSIGRQIASNMTTTDTMNISVSSSFASGANAVLTLTHQLITSSRTHYQRETIKYNASDQVIAVDIDTASSKLIWGLITAYTYEYNLAGSVTRWVKKKNVGGVLRNDFSSHFSYSTAHKPIAGKSITYDRNGIANDSALSTYYYTHSKIDSISNTGFTKGMGRYLYVPHYSGSSIYKIDTYTSFLGEALSLTGSTLFYKYNVTAWKEQDLLDRAKVVNPIRNTLEVHDSPEVAVELIDINGQVVMSASSRANPDVSTLPKGIYFLHLKGEKAISVKKLIKE